ncbi:MAG: hypothetical protein Tsb0017_13930 [Geothermobacteraceae bacterium]
MKLFGKMLSSFSVMALLCALVGGIGWWGIHHTRDGLEQVGNQRLPAVQNLGLMMEALNAIKATEKTMTNPASTAAERRFESKNLRELRQQMEQIMADYAALPRTGAEDKLWEEYRKTWTGLLAAQDQLLKKIDHIALDEVDHLEAVLLARHLDHINWVRGLEKAVLNRRAFNGQLNPLRCGLGKFLLSFMSDDREFNGLLDKFAQPHRMLHNFGREINDLIAEGNYDEARRLLDSKVKPTLAGIEGIFSEVVEYVRQDAGDLREALKVAKGTERVAFEGAMASLDKLMAQSLEQTALARSEAEREAALSQTLSLAAVVLGVVLALVFGVFSARSLARPMQKLVAMIRELDNGHLDTRLHLKRGDEIGEVAATMDAFADSLQAEVVDNLEKLARGDLTFEVSPRDGRDRVRGALVKLGTDLNQLLGQVQTASLQITQGAGQVADTSQTLSQGATEQASSLEEMAASMNQMAAQVKQSYEHIRRANSLSDEAQSMAEEGDQRMAEMIAAMNDIDHASQEISKIIKVIDEIAFQTNLLALNAAVEAARAGQHGKGFAVVAEEVRNLAARSAKAAQETAALIEGSVAKSERGTRIANETAGALQLIVAKVTEVAGLLDEVAVASREQTEGIAQVNEGLNQIDKVTQINTASAEESAATSEELSSQAQQLQLLLAQFRLKSDFNEGSLGATGPLVAWTSKFETGLGNIDQQHQGLVDLVNETFDCMKGKGSGRTVLEVLEALSEYADNHFADEEDLMRRYRYPDLNLHMAEHQSFIAWLNDFKQRMAVGQEVDFGDVFNYLREWCHEHFLNTDQRGYVAYIRKKLAQ